MDSRFWKKIVPKIFARYCRKTTHNTSNNNSGKITSSNNNSRKNNSTDKAASLDDEKEVGIKDDFPFAGAGL